jgi:hypothetical protein
MTINQPPQRKHHGVRNGCLLSSGIVVLALIAMIAIGAALTGGSHPAARRSHPAAATVPAVTQTPVPAVTQTPVAAALYTVPQQQAIASAKSYLSSEPGFSKAGLIDQLHSQYGEGFSKKLAVFAVNHIKVNWRQQAVYSARSYMKSEPGWSYSGLVDQLHSPYGEQFTLAQAEYAAKAVGL